METIHTLAFKDFLELLPAVVCELDANYLILKANKRAKQIFLPLAKEGMADISMAKLFTESSWRKFLEATSPLLNAALPQPSPLEFDLPIDGKGLEFCPYQWQIGSLLKEPSSERGAFYVFGLDATTKVKDLEKPFCTSQERLIAQDKEILGLKAVIEQQKAKLEEGAKFAQLGEMASGIVHEINNPISIIKGHADHLQQHLKKEPLDLVLLQRSSLAITNTVDRVSAIIKSMRALARDGTQDPFEPTDLVKIIRDSAVFFHEKLRGKRIKLRLEAASEVLVIEARGVQISQVFLNLLSNAYDAVMSLPERWIDVKVFEESEHVFLHVTDSGKRIADDTAQKIMQPLFTTKSAENGTGLGLSISQAIVHQHGGSLRLDPDCPHTRFIVELPKSKAASDSCA